MVFTPNIENIKLCDSLKKKVVEKIETIKTAILTDKKPLTFTYENKSFRKRKTIKDWPFKFTTGHVI